MELNEPLLEWAVRELKQKGIPSPRGDAEELLSHVAGITRQDLWKGGRMDFTLPERVFYRRLVKGRAGRLPVSYLTGRREFMGFEFFVKRNVFIPRPETELLVEEAVRYAAKIKSPLVIIDMCSGCGNVGISIARILMERGRSDFVVYAVDISPDAIAVSMKNAVHNKVREKMKIIRGDLFRPLRKPDLVGKVDFIVSNPPYVKEGDLSTIQEEVKKEPERAIDGGRDGLAFYRRIMEEAPGYLKKSALLFLEIGYDQALAVSAMATGTGKISVEKIRKDYAGLDRIIVGRRT